MPQIVWLAPQIEIRPKHFVPAIEMIREGRTGSFPCVWKPSRLPATWVVGLADVTAEQLTAILADPSILVADRVDESRTMVDVGAPTRTRLNQFCDDAGVPRPRDVETLRELVDRLAIRARGLGVENMEQHLLVEISAYAKLAERDESPGP